MKLATLGDLNARICGGADRDGGGDGPVVVLLHGFGAPGSDLVSLWRVVAAPPGTRFVFPEAPIDLGPMYGGGRAWWRIDMARLQLEMARGNFRARAAEAPVGIEEARASVISMLDAIEREMNVTRDKIVLGGFSQGAMLACDVALRDRPPAALVMLSGTVVAEKEWTPLLAARSTLPIFMSHGSDDPILPVTETERLKSLFEGAGINVDWVPFRGGHEIPQVVVERLGAFVKRALG